MKKLITNYSFNHTAKTITFNDYSSIDLEKVLLITNVTRNVILYNFADPNKGGSVSGNVLTLDCDTSGMADTDKLQIFYDDINPAREDGNLAKIPGLAIPIHDYIGLTYTGGNLTQIVYKQGGASGTTVATLTLSYDDSGNLTSVSKS